MDGQPVGPLMGSLKSPNAWLHVNSDYANTTQLIPVAPGVTRARIIWFVRVGAREGVDYDRQRVVDFWKITTEQDWRLCETNYAGTIPS
jgi:Rieske 2Fe-2S family protein